MKSGRMYTGSNEGFSSLQQYNDITSSEKVRGDGFLKSCLKSPAKLVFRLVRCVGIEGDRGGVRSKK